MLVRASSSLVGSLCLGAALCLGLPAGTSQDATAAGKLSTLMDRLFKPPARTLGLQELAAWLRREGVPLCFVERPEASSISLVPDGEPKTLRSIFQGAVREAGYDYELIADRVVVFPAGALYRTRVSAVSISNTARLEATDQYLEHLARAVPGLGEVIPPIMKGDPRAPIYSEPVSLSAEASILEHLVELLGQDTSLEFSLIRWTNGKRYLLFERRMAGQETIKDGREGAGR